MGHAFPIAQEYKPLTAPTAHPCGFASLRLGHRRVKGFAWQPCTNSMAQRGVDTSTAAFVGTSAPPADSYYDSDFSWQEHRIDLEAALPKHILEDLQELSLGSISSHNAIQIQANAEDASWEKFHAKDNATAKFYKERRYLLLEFPELLTTEPAQHFAEIGCGCGSSVLPVLKANPTCRVTATDLSPTAVCMLNGAAKSAGIHSSRLTSFAFDAALPSRDHHLLQGLSADGLLLIFTLAALPPDQMTEMLRTAFQALRPGGLLFLRDHGICDITHLRLKEEQRQGHRLYRRGDNTHCYFFSVEDLQSRMEAAGFTMCDCKYACVTVVNRKTGQAMRRVFVHGKFQKPMS